MVFQKEFVQKTKDKVISAKHIVIVAHKSPDGDSVGSSLALYHFLKTLNEKVQICHPDAAPTHFSVLKGFDEIINYNDQQEAVIASVQQAELIFCLDFNVLHRLGKEMEELIAGSNAFKVMIDHHLYPSDEFDVVFSDTSSCSTAQLIFEFIESLDMKANITVSAGEAMYCGMMTDSGSFRFPSVTPKTHQVVAQLLSIGVENAKIHEAIYDTNTLDRLKLRGFATNEKLEILPEHNTAIISLSEEELNRFNYQQGDSDGLVNVGLSIVGIHKSVFFKEQNGIIKISFRSKGLNNPINELASRYFSGGGHANAAGGKWEGSLEGAITEFKRVLNEF